MSQRILVDASKAAGPSTQKRRKGQPSKADVALGKIRKLYRIESELKDRTDDQRYAARQKLAVSILEDLKAWLDKNLPKVPKGGLTHTAIQYMLNQWNYLIGYCNDGKLQISNALAENAIRPFAMGRRAWLLPAPLKGHEPVQLATH